MTLKYEPWGNEPIFEWDKYNEDKFWQHRIRDFEVEACFKNSHDVLPHHKARSEPEKYRHRYVVLGVTDGGRKLRIIVQHKGSTVVRLITGWVE